MSRANVGFWLFRTKRADGTFHPRWRFRYVGPDGRLTKGTGFTDKGETKRLAQQLALEADEIRRGVRAAPRLSDTESSRPIAEHIDEYLRWGATQGGRGGRPWAKKWLFEEKQKLAWWIEVLRASALRDITLPGVEKALQEKAARDGVTGKTLSLIASVLHGFLTWCLERKYLAAHPLDGLRDFDTSVTPEHFRRAFTLEEIGKLLAVTPEPRKLVYRLALVTGFRANEVKSLRVGDLDTGKKTVRLSAEHAKDRREAVCALPKDLMDALAPHVSGRPADEPIFPAFNPNDAANRIAKDMKAAGIPARTFGGKAVFASLRTTHVTLGVELGFDVKTAQTLARHKDPRLTMNTYARLNAERMRSAVNSLDAAIVGAEVSRNSPTGVQREPLALAAGAENLPQVRGGQAESETGEMVSRRSYSLNKLPPGPRRSARSPRSRATSSACRAATGSTSWTRSRSCSST